jgi:hypothetical protein
MSGGFKNHEQPLFEIWDPCLAVPCPGLAPRPSDPKKRQPRFHKLACAKSHPTSPPREPRVTFSQADADYVFFPFSKMRKDLQQTPLPLNFHSKSLHLEKPHQDLVVGLLVCWPGVGEMEKWDVYGTPPLPRPGIHR